MITFILGCAGLLLLSGLFYLLPGRERASVEEDQSRANLEWYQLRAAELANEGSEDLATDAQLRLLEDEHQRVAAGAAPRAPASRSMPLWPLAVFVTLLAATLYYHLGAAADVRINRQLQTLDESAEPGEMQALVEAIERRAARRPGNLHYVALLGQFYMGQQDYSRAAATYRELARAAPQDAQALAYAAQAEYLARDRELTTEAQMLAEQALAIDPHSRTALGLLGMAAFERGQYRAAIEYWQRLVAMEQPGSETARMIGGVIETARQRLGESGLPAVAVAEEADAASGTVSAGVTVTVAFPDGAEVAPDDTVFVLARNADSDSRMPVAVRRLQASQLPVTLRLDDSSSMAGQKLSELASVVVLVQVSPDGRPGESSATWLGSAGPLAPSLEQEPLAITLTPRG